MQPYAGGAADKYCLKILIPEKLFAAFVRYCAQISGEAVLQAGIFQHIGICAERNLAGMINSI